MRTISDHFDTAHGAILRVVIGLSHSEEARRRRESEQFQNADGVEALVDPGTEVTVISRRVFDVVRPLPLNAAEYRIPLLPPALRLAYEIEVLFTTEVSLRTLAVVLDLSGSLDCVIGRDLLRRARFSCDGEVQRFDLEFRDALYS